MKLSRLAICLAMVLITAVASAQSDTVFTYQGELKENGSPANGTFNMEFSLWDAEFGGSPLGGVTLNVPVVDGRFTAQLDFGGAAFDNSTRWLAIEINGVPLSQRNIITRTPYAIQTRGIFVNDQGFAAIGNINPQASLHTTQIDPLEDIMRLDHNNGQVAMKVDLFGLIELGDRDVNGALGINPIQNYVSLGFIDSNSGTVKLLIFKDKVAFPANGPVLIGTDIPSGSGQFEVIAAGFGNPRAVQATSSTGETSSFGVYAESTSPNGTGIRGIANSGSSAYGVWGESDEGYAGVFSGNVDVSGTLSKDAGSFKIDHPLDPENKYLSHSFVESPDMMNVYNGNIVTDAEGYATVTLPEWFEVLNRDFRYQLTVIADGNNSDFVQAMIVERINDNRFKIRSSAPNTEVSWLVTGVRQDPYAEANRILVEQMKPNELRGLYRHPELYGKTTEFREESIKLSAMGREQLKPSENSAN